MPDPDIDWIEDRLHSNRFHDIYFAQDGPAETRRVFIEPANLIERIRNESVFSIMEFGFGTGLNFLTLAQLLSDHRVTTRVRYISVDKFPLNTADIARALTPFRTELRLVDGFLNKIPPRIPGWHRRYFSNNRLELILCYNDVVPALDEFLACDDVGIDAWFLDGFAPNRNPEMWRPELFEKLHTITKRGGTVTTFSAAGHVRNSLQAAGFQVQRIEGRASQKRHTTLARVEGHGFQPTSPPTRARVVGGGLAGATVAQSLARKGVSVELHEREASVGASTSAIPAAIQHPRLSAADTLLALFRVHAYAHAQSLLKAYDAVSSIGAVHLPDDGMPMERLTGVAELLGDDWIALLDIDATRELTRQATESAWFPRSAVVNGAQLCDELLKHELIHVSTGHEGDLNALDDEVPTIYATGCDIPGQIDEMPIEAIVIPGQVDAFAVSGTDNPIHHVVAHNGYIAPRRDVLFAGSTYEYRPWAKGEATRTNKARIEYLLRGVDLELQAVFRADRVVSSDRLPIVGEVASHRWVSWAHGSGGTITAPFAAELIASSILKEIPAGSPEIPRLLYPDRFRIRQQRRPNPLTRGFRTGPKTG